MSKLKLMTSLEAYDDNDDVINESIPVMTHSDDIDIKNINDTALSIESLYKVHDKVKDVNKLTPIAASMVKLAMEYNNPLDKYRTFVSLEHFSNIHTSETATKIAIESVGDTIKEFVTKLIARVVEFFKKLGATLVGMYRFIRGLKKNVTEAAKDLSKEKVEVVDLVLPDEISKHFNGETTLTVESLKDHCWDYKDTIDKCAVMIDELSDNVHKLKQVMSSSADIDFDGLVKDIKGSGKNFGVLKRNNTVLLNGYLFTRVKGELNVVVEQTKVTPVKDLPFKFIKTKLSILDNEVASTEKALEKLLNDSRIQSIKQDLISILNDLDENDLDKRSVISSLLMSATNTLNVCTSQIAKLTGQFLKIVESILNAVKKDIGGGSTKDGYTHHALLVVPANRLPKDLAVGEIDNKTLTELITGTVRACIYKIGDKKGTDILNNTETDDSPIDHSTENRVLVHAQIHADDGIVSKKNKLNIREQITNESSSKISAIKNIVNARSSGETNGFYKI